MVRPMLRYSVLWLFNVENHWSITLVLKYNLISMGIFDIFVAVQIRTDQTTLYVFSLLRSNCSCSSKN
jgi:hypothetical protein